MESGVKATMDESPAVNTDGNGSAQPQELDKHSEIISLSENSNNENREKELLERGEVNDSNASTSADDVSHGYEKDITYNEKGTAIYTDPKTKCQYEFDTVKNEWLPIKEGSNANKTGETSQTEAANSTNPYENEHYRWCTETNQWIAKENQNVLENEFYKWDSAQNQWIPKTHGSEVSTNIVDGVHTYTDKDGATFFWDDKKNAWFPKIDDDFMAMYQMSYGFVDNTSGTSSDVRKEDEAVEEKDVPEEEIKNGDKETKSSNKRKNQAESQQWFELPPEQNTKVYVSNLPDDITEEEFIEIMSKCGMIFRDPGSNKLKVKLYAEADGQLKGDGLCHYIRVESVDLALNLLDGSDVRGKRIKVQRAKFEMRGQYNPTLKPKKKKKDKEKLKKMQEKLLDWRPEQMRGERPKHERIVIIKNLFAPELFDTEVHLIIDYQRDLREECSKCGKVSKVVIFDRHPEGVAQINMGDAEEADLVVQMMNKRYFGKRQLTAELYDGKTNYKVNETKEEMEKRLSKWDQFLDDEEEKEKSVAHSNVDCLDDE
ncbi:hypothetical protein HA402_004611 [Bradysia odoriphaga]|nr:hypothetical protein HA402_004611 [Bradysia odoriphaga]